MHDNDPRTEFLLARRKILFCLVTQHVSLGRMDNAPFLDTAILSECAALQLPLLRLRASGCDPTFNFVRLIRNCTLWPTVSGKKLDCFRDHAGAKR
jgi:hypothetical protein